MDPFLPTPYVVKVPKRNATYFSHLLPCEMLSPLLGFDIFYRFLVYFAHSVRFSEWMSIFKYCIVNIFKISAYPEMGWINARPIVTIWTIMKNAHSVRNWTKMKNPACSMRGNTSIFPATSCYGSVPNCTCFFPHPTGLCNYKAFKESLRKGFGKSLRTQIICRNSELLSIAHNILGRASGCLLGIAEAFLVCNIKLPWSRI